jgi:hypothetical protein
MCLHYIREEVCPSCGAGITSEEWYGVHTNRQRNEVRMFQCGYTLHWSPNYSALRVTKPCPRGDEELAKQKREADLKLALITMINEADVDDAFRESLMRYWYTG